MSRLTHTLIAASLTLAVPLLALAASVAPENVRGIVAERKGPNIVVSWQSAGTNIDHYRVYWSNASILGNDGNYDDSEDTAGDVTTFMLKSMPSDQETYVAVIAIDAAGQESPAFAEEAYVAITAKSPADNLRLLTVTPVTANSVRLMFSHVLVLNVAALENAIQITDGSGALLPVTGLKLADNSLLITTAAQKSGSYNVALTPSAFFGLPKDSGAAPLVLADRTGQSFKSTVPAPVETVKTVITAPARASSSSATTSSVATTASESPASSSSSVKKASSDKLALSLESFPRTDDFYDVELGWQLDDQDVGGFALSQSIDGGKTFGNPQILPSDMRMVRIERVPAGSFTVNLTPISISGAANLSTERSILLGNRGTAVPPAPLATVVTTSTITPSTPLTSSGPASLVLTLIVTGAAVGLLQARRVLRAH